MEDARWSENVEDVQSFPSAGFIWWFCHCLYKIGTFYCFELQSLGCSHVGSLFTNEEQKRLPHDVFASPSGFVHVITDTDRWT